MGKLGALSIDAMQAQAKIYDKSYTGGSYRILYAKSFSDSGTNIQLTGLPLFYIKLLYIY
ncbi:Outer membrane usher protein fimD precursor [Moellerella wisconsensis]|nr:Outer membrane usher protein fimD precursor [Moellerella wisconsensis]